MTNKTQAFESECCYRGVRLRVVRHASVEKMRIDIIENYCDEFIDEMMTDPTQHIGMVKALTIGQYIDKDPNIIVFCPVMDKDDQAIAIPHEALHVTMAIVRHELANTIDSLTPILISREENSTCCITEEDFCIIAGEVSAMIWQAISKIDSHIKKLGA